MTRTGCGGRGHADSVIGMKLATASLAVVFALTGCGGSEDAADDAPAAQPAEATQAPESEAPEVEETKDPNDTSENKTACEAARREVSERADVFNDVAKGTALPTDAAAAAGELQSEIGDLASFSTGAIGNDLSALSDAYGRARVSITTGDLDGLNAAVQEQTARLTSLNEACTAIGK